MNKIWLSIAFIVVLLLVFMNGSGQSPKLVTGPRGIAGPAGPAGPSAAPRKYADASLADSNIDLGIGCLGDQAVALSSSLLPREISTQEDFGAFSPDDLLKNQNFLDPSQSIGINTVSGSLRNGNQQVRSDPPNPQGRVPFNQTTITPNLMQPYFEIGCN